MTEDEINQLETEEPEPTLPPPPVPVINVYGTLDQWLQNDPILKDGQLGIEYDPTTYMAKLKAGYGRRPYSELPYINGGAALQMMQFTEGGPPAVLETIPAPPSSGLTLLSLDTASLMWSDMDPGTFVARSLFAPLVLRERVGGIVGPPAQIAEGQLAVNLNGHRSGDARPSLYIGIGNDQTSLVFEQADMAHSVVAKSLVLAGGNDVADALNHYGEPVAVKSNEIWVIVYNTNTAYLFTASDGRYGSVDYTGQGGPGLSVVPDQFVPIALNYAPANEFEIVDGAAPNKTVNAGPELVNAIRTIVQQELAK